MEQYAPRVIVDRDGDVWIEIRGTRGDSWGEGQFAMVPRRIHNPYTPDRHTFDDIRLTYGLARGSKTYRADRLGPSSPKAR